MADAFAIVPFDDSDDEGTVSMAGGGGGAVATRVTFRVAINPKAVRDREGEGVSIHGSIQVTHTYTSFAHAVCLRDLPLLAAPQALHAGMNPLMLSHQHLKSRVVQHQHTPT